MVICSVFILFHFRVARRQLGEEDELKKTLKQKQRTKEDGTSPRESRRNDARTKQNKWTLNFLKLFISRRSYCYTDFTHLHIPRAHYINTSASSAVGCCFVLHCDDVKPH